MGNREMYNTTLNADLTKKMRILAAQLDRRHNDLLEEAIQDLLKKYKNENIKDSQLDTLVAEII
jgi:predicted transcriptional regulator